MNRRELLDCLLFAGLRLMAVALLIAGGLELFFQLIESWYRFDPNYLAAFLFQTVFRPVVLILAGLVLYLLAAPLSRKLGRGALPPSPTD
jgi:chromate transport protein ChrA